MWQRNYSFVAKGLPTQSYQLLGARGRWWRGRFRTQVSKSVLKVGSLSLPCCPEWAWTSNKGCRHLCKHPKTPGNVHIKMSGGWHDFLSQPSGGDLGQDGSDDNLSGTHAPPLASEASFWSDYQDEGECHLSGCCCLSCGPLCLLSFCSHWWLFGVGGHWSAESTYLLCCGGPPLG